MTVNYAGFAIPDESYTAICQITGQTGDEGLAKVVLAIVLAESSAAPRARNCQLYICGIDCVGVIEETILSPDTIGDAYANPLCEDSVGLLQLNRNGGQGTGYTVSELSDPYLNAGLGIPPIINAYYAGLSLGLDNESLVCYTATRSGHPGMISCDDARIVRIISYWQRMTEPLPPCEAVSQPSPSRLPIAILATGVVVLGLAATRRR